MSRGFGLAAALVAALLAAPPLRAQSVPTPVIITVDVQQILRDSTVAKDVQAQMDQRTQTYTRQVTSQESELQKTQEELEQQRTLLAPEAFNARMRDFQQRYDALDNRVQETRQALQQSYNDAMTKVETTALQIISDIATERKANLVVTKAAVLFEAPELDITQEVIKRLDAKLPKVEVAAPQEAALGKPGASPVQAPPPSGPAAATPGGAKPRPGPPVAKPPR
jgi:outer membrane protein